MLRSTTPTPTITASSAVVPNQQQPANGQGSSDARNYYPAPAACLLPVSGNFSTPAMAAQRTIRSSAKQDKLLQQPAVIKKQTEQKTIPKVSKAGLEYIADMEEKENQQPDKAEEMKISEDEVEFEEAESPFTFQATQPTSQTQKQDSKRPAASAQSQATYPPQTRINKNGKVQELVPVKAPKTPDPIRGLLGGSRFSIEEILKLPLTMEVGQFLDKSDIARNDKVVSPNSFV